MAGDIERSHFTQLPDSWLYREDITVYDCRVMHALMSFCTKEGVHKVSMRQLANIAHVSLSILCTTDEEAKKPKEGILNKFDAMEYIALIYARDVDPITGQAKGQVQTFIRMNYVKIWQDNETFFQEYRTVKLDGCLVPDDSFVEISKGVRQTNTLECQTNTSDGATNSRDRRTNKSVRLPRSNFTRDVPDTTRDHSKTNVDTSTAAFHDLYFSSEHHRGSKKIDTKRIEQYQALAPYVTTHEQLTRLVEFAKGQLPPNNDGRVYLGNLVNSVDDWRKSEETVQESAVFSSSQGMPGDVQMKAVKICNHYGVDAHNHLEQFKKTYLYARLDPKLFKRLMDDAKDAPDIEQFFRKVKKLIVG